MKKILLPLLVVFIFWGCSSKDAADSKDVKMKMNVAEKPFAPGAAEISALIEKIDGDKVSLKVEQIHQKGRQTPKLSKGNNIVVTYKLNTNLNSGEVYKFVIQSAIVPGSEKPHWTVSSVK